MSSRILYQKIMICLYIKSHGKYHRTIYFVYTGYLQNTWQKFKCDSLDYYRAFFPINKIIQEVYKNCFLFLLLPTLNRQPKIEATKWILFWQILFPYFCIYHQVINISLLYTTDLRAQNKVSVVKQSHGFFVSIGGS